MRHLIDIKDLSVSEIDGLINTAEDIIADPGKYAHLCDGKKTGDAVFRAVHPQRLFL